MDLTPTYELLPAEQEIVLPPIINDAMGQTVGGFVATPNQLSNGKITLQGVAERILIGSATDPNVGVGIFLGSDQQATVGYDFRAGDPAGNYIWWDASAATLTISGAITATSGTIGGFSIGADYVKDAADSFGLASTVTGGDDVRFWAGTTFASRSSAPFRVTEAGAVTGTNFTHSGGSVTGVTISSIPNNSSTDISLLEKTWSMTFSVTDADTIAWTSGTVTLSNGRTFSISSGNTGNMAALTYIYVDPAVSSTALQTTTTAATAMGANKVLIGTAQNNTVTASFIPYGPGQPLVDGANIGALSIVAGNIAASTITAAKLTVAQLSAIAADMGTLTTGVINMSSGTANIHAGQSAYDTGTGFWLEYNSGTPRFSIGNSAGSKVTWDGSILSIVGNENISKVYTAGGSINANDAVYLDGYQSDGGVTFDASSETKSTADGSGNISITPITVGSNSNRILVIGLYVSTNGATPTLNWNGTSITQLDSVALPSSGGTFLSYYLIAPATGLKTLTGASFGVSATYRMHIHSYYNAKQTGQPDGHGIAAAANPSAATVTLTPSTAGSLFWGMAVNIENTSIGSLTGIPNNQRSGTTSFAGTSGDNGNITVIRSQSISLTSSATNRMAVCAISITPQTTAVASVKQASANASTTADAFIGFAKASATAGNSVTVYVSGDVGGFSGLTFGLPYYLANTAGTISSTAGSVTRKVGIATSSTNIAITNIW